MRGLNEAERIALLASTVPGDPGEDITGNDTETAAYQSLVRRGCVRERVVDQMWSDEDEEEVWTWDITPRGRLALQCDAAVRAVLA